jgi:uncharacterized protein YndB with AHSA1/START domain
MEPLELRFAVACSPAHAFEVWTRRISTWWPRGHSVSADPQLAVTIEPFAGGRIYERTAVGEEHEWGEVVAWEPPRRLAYRWHLRQDRADATEVTIDFASEGDGTAVTIVHRGWERLGARGPGLRERNRRGWAGLLEHYVRACA